MSVVAKFFKKNLSSSSGWRTSSSPFWQARRSSWTGSMPRTPRSRTTSWSQTRAGWQTAPGSADRLLWLLLLSWSQKPAGWQTAPGSAYRVLWLSNWVCFIGLTCFHDVVTSRSHYVMHSCFLVVLMCYIMLSLCQVFNNKNCSFVIFLCWTCYHSVLSSCRDDVVLSAYGIVLLSFYHVMLSFCYVVLCLCCFTLSKSLFFVVFLNFANNFRIL